MLPSPTGAGSIVPVYAHLMKGTATLHLDLHLMQAHAAVMLPLKLTKESHLNIRKLNPITKQFLEQQAKIATIIRGIIRTN